MDSKVISVVFAAIFLAIATAGPVIDDNKGHIDNSVHPHEYNTVEESLMKKLNNKCSDRDISACMMLKLVTYFNRMLKKSSIEFGDVEITQTSAEVVATESGRSMNAENMPEEEQLAQVFMDKVSSFLQTRSLKWKVIDGADLVINGNTDKEGGLNVGLSLRPSPSGEGEEARKKKGNMMGPLIAAAAMKIGLLKALAFKALVLLVGKALIVSKLALVLAAVIGLKKLLHHEKHVTYEVVSHPHHEHHDHHDHHVSSSGGDYGGWGRNFETAQKMAYSAQIPAN